MSVLGGYVVVLSAGGVLVSMAAKERLSVRRMETRKARSVSNVTGKVLPWITIGVLVAFVLLNPLG